MKSKRIKFFGITLGLVHSPFGNGFFITKPFGALHVHMGKVGFWLRKGV